MKKFFKGGIKMEETKLDYSETMVVQPTFEDGGIRYLPFVVFVVADDIVTIDDKTVFDNFVKLVNTSCHTVIEDPIYYFNTNYVKTLEKEVAEIVDRHDTDVYADIFDSLAKSCDAIYYVKLPSDENSFNEIVEKLMVMYKQYVRKGYTNIKKISVFADKNEIPFD
jgi:N-acyl-D-aspartate/D-glutamate deacylase